MYYYVQRIQDADALVNTTDAPFRFPTSVAGLHTSIAKKALERVQLLKAVYEEFQRAADEDEDRRPKLQPSAASGAN